MKHRVGFNRLGRKPAHRESMTRNMVTSLIVHERIKTTKTKAQAIRRVAEKMVTRAKEDSVHNRRIIAKRIKDKSALAKLFTELGPRFKTRPGGYTRLLKLGPRPSDAAEMVILEFVERTGEEEVAPKLSRSARRKAAEQEAEASEEASEPKKSEEKKPEVAAEASAAAEKVPADESAAEEPASDQEKPGEE